MFRFTQESISKAFWESVSQFHYEVPPPQDSRSMRPQNLVYLAQLCLKLSPYHVIEIGSGQSTEVMRRCGVERIVSCDRKATPRESEGVIIHDTESTEMLVKLTDAADLFFFDGRLKREDSGHVKRLSRASTWYVFDDFEGLEKGVANAAALCGNDRFLMTPQPGVIGRSTLAVLAPVSELQFSIYG